MRRLPSLFLAIGLALPLGAGAQDSDTDTDPPADTQQPEAPAPTDEPTDFVATGGRTVTCDTRGPAPAAWLGLALLGGLALRRRRTTGLAVLLAVGVVSEARAQGLPAPTIDVNRFEPSGMASGFATVYTARQLPAVRFSGEAFFAYGWRPLQGSAEVAGNLIRRVGAVEHLGSGHLRFAVGATDWLEVGLGMPVAQIADLGPGIDAFAGPRTSPWAVGDLYLELKFRPVSEQRGTGLAIIPFATAPTGNRRYLLSESVPTFGARAAVSGRASVVHLAAHAGYKVKLGSSTLGSAVAVDDEVLYGAGLGFAAIPRRFRVNLELAGATIVGPGRRLVPKTLAFERLHTSMEALLGFQVATPSGFALTVGGGAALTPAAGSPAIRGFLGLGYVPISDPDPDGDGVLGADDRCPEDPEDLDGWQDDDGCPDPDDDGDGLLDGEDDCPREPEDVDGFEDDDGCPDDDDDGDGIPDVDDLCPRAPEDIDGDRDDDGCPDHGANPTDQDGDGIDDSRDACPELPEDLDGWEDLDGCPDTDDDGDGIPDDLDPCPRQAEDFDGLQDDDGCPEADADGDGIIDTTDACPEAPEIINGVDDADGCPDEGKVKLAADRIEILERILFFVSEARIKPESNEILDAVTTILVDRPDIVRIRIEGHTDSSGGEAYNQDLSERRALAIRQYLIDHGVSPGRLLARGYGELYPIAPNSTPEGRAENRRVEFLILDGAEPEPE